MKNDLNHFVWKLEGDHALSAHDVQQFRKTLRADAKEWPDARLHRHTDELILLVGMSLGVVSRKRSKEQLLVLEPKLHVPVERLLRALKDPDLEAEYLQPWSQLCIEERNGLVVALEKFKENVEKHIAQIKGASAQGKRWDSELKDHFVTYVSMLCEYINHDFLPSRSVDEGKEGYSQFRDAVAILSKPLPWRENERDSVNFDHTIRMYMDRWNSNFNKK